MGAHNDFFHKHWLNDVTPLPAALTQCPVCLYLTSMVLCICDAISLWSFQRKIWEQHQRKCGSTPNVIGCWPILHPGQTPPILYTIPLQISLPSMRNAHILLKRTANMVLASQFLTWHIFIPKLISHLFRLYHGPLVVKKTERKISISPSICYYPNQGGYVFTCVLLCVCLLVVRFYPKTTDHKKKQKKKNNEFP